MGQTKSTFWRDGNKIPSNKVEFQDKFKRLAATYHQRVDQALVKLNNNSLTSREYKEHVD